MRAVQDPSYPGNCPVFIEPLPFGPVRAHKPFLVTSVILWATPPLAPGP